MYGNMETLHSLGILIRDIHPGNYLGGNIIDFSRSWTIYHPCLDQILWPDLCQLREEELIGFMNMILTWANAHDTKIKIPKGLSECSGGIENCGINPCDYDCGRTWTGLMFLGKMTYRARQTTNRSITISRTVIF